MANASTTTINSKLNGRKFVIRLSGPIVYSTLIGLLPLLMYFRIPTTDFGLGTLLSVLLLPYVIIVQISKGIIKRQGWHNSLLVFLLYIIIRSVNNPTAMILYTITLLHVACANITIKWDVIQKTVVTTSIVASIIIIIQRVLAILGIYISFYAKQLMIDEFRYIDSVYVGSQLTRVSGIFAEPSHFAAYALIALTIMLVNSSQKSNLSFKKALIISIAILCSTSGIGMLGAFAVWGYYILFSAKSMRRVSIIIRVCSLLLLALVAFAVLLIIPMTRLSLLRIIGYVDGYNAVWGRTLANSYYLANLKGLYKVVGLGITDMKWYATSLIQIIFQFGYLGILFFIVALISIIAERDKRTIALCLIYIGLLISSDASRFLMMIFYFSVIISSCTNTFNTSTSIHAKQQFMCIEY